ncbi:MAG: single-stranded-DNA-specific exonuclease RecJ, partial [Desulfobulbaceae bacterium]|nr:single-stranded-DNA-specific exonuclease RecJ [Desulfobulbaceae bacterium]
MHSKRPVVCRREPAADVISGLSDVDPLFARLYAARGVTAAAQLDYGLASMAPVSSLDNIDAAVRLLLEKRDQHITIVGDFDVDGATSTALM